MSTNKELLKLVQTLNRKIDQLAERVEATTPAAAQPTAAQPASASSGSVEVRALEEFFPSEIRSFQGEICSSKVDKERDYADYLIRKKFNKLLKELLKNFLPE